jgi:hypothetical protein
VNSLSKVFNRLEYVGTGKGVIVNILPSRLSVKVSKDIPYEFRPTDQMDEVAEKYYKSMRSVGIRLITDETESEITKAPEITEVKPESTQSQEDSTQEELSSDNITSDVVSEEDKSESDVHETAEVTEVNNAELIEFLDLNYSDDDLRNIAKDAGVKRIQSSWTKQTLIDKIISTNVEYVVKLIKNN